MGAKLFLLRRPRTDEADADDWRGCGAAVAGALANFAQFALEPELPAGAVKDERGVAMPQTLLVIGAHLGLVAVEERTDDLELLLLEEIVGPGTDGDRRLVCRR